MFDYTRDSDGVCWLPHHLREGMQGFLEEGWQPGDFLREVLSNNLNGAVAHGDYQSLTYLPHIVIWLNMEAPADAWGTPEKYEAWIVARRGVRGLR